MATLLEKLQQNLGQVAAPSEPAGGETATVQRLLSAKKGIIGGPTGPQGLAVGDIAARAPAQQQLAQLGQAAQLQSTAIGQAAAGQAEEQRQREQAVEGQRAETSLRGRIQTESILQGLEQGKAELGERQRQQGLEQVAASLRLQDAQYVDNLRREGERARLDEDISFAEQLQKSIFENNAALLKMQLKNKSLLAADDREFNKSLARMGYDDAIRAARENIKADQQRALIGGVASMVPVGMQAYGGMQKGAYDTGYQSYLRNAKAGEAMGYEAWQAEQTRQAEIDRMASGGKTLPAVGRTKSYGSMA